MIRITANQVCRAFFLSCILWAPAIQAADAPASIQPGSQPAGEEVEAIQAPAIPVMETELPLGLELIPHDAVITDPNDKGSVYTDGSLGAIAGPPTALESAKLAMGRAAIEASRQAGTLQVAPTEITPDQSGDETEAMKLTRLATTPPAPVIADPAAGSGVETAPVQMVGPVGMTPEELQKLGKERN